MTDPHVSHLRFLVVLCGMFPLAGLLSLSPASAAEPQAAAATPPASVRADTLPDTLAPQLREKLADAHEKFNRYAAESGTTTNLPPGATETEALEYRSLLQRLTQTYQSHLDDIAAYEASRQRLKDFQRETKTWTGFAEKPPYSILKMDEIRDTIQALEKQIQMLETAQTFMNRLAVDTGTFVETCDGKIRHYTEQLEGATDKTQIIRITWQRTLEQTRRQAAAASLAVFDTKYKRRAMELDENRQRLAFARRQLALIGQNVCFSQQDLDKVLVHLDTFRTQTKADELAAYARLEKSQRALAKARADLQRALQTAGQTAGSDAIRHLQEIVETRNIQTQADTEIITCFRQLQRSIDSECQLWQMRYTILQKRDPAEIQETTKKLDRLYDLILSAKPFYIQQIDVITSRIAEQQASRMNIDKDSDPALAQQRLDAFQEQEQAYNNVLKGLEKHEHMIQCWREALAGEAHTKPLGKRVRDSLVLIRSLIAGAWNFELFVVQDTITVDGQRISGHRGITVGKIILAVLILVIGYGLSKRTARWLERLSIRQLKIAPNQASLIRRWTHVILVAILVVFSLESVKIPLTIFAFAGGALAIGVGFGTQNLLKNFISGIIILFERPFRVGDVLDISGQCGKVTAIGIRSSVIQSWDSTETLIPNSVLLENNLTNWTYSSKAVRITVTVGVAYGSDTRLVAQLLCDIAERHGQVQKDPKPIVLFSDFGDSALSFDLMCWVDVQKHNSAKVASDIRHMIAGTFAEHGIVIAFPQRDLHLDTARPLQVRIEPPAGSRAS